MTLHRTSLLDKALLYVLSADVEFSLDIEEVGNVPGGARFNVSSVSSTSRVYNVLRERTLGAPGYPAVEGTIVWGQDAALLGENDLATADVRAIIQTDDGALIDATYSGILPLGAGAFRSLVGALDAPGTAERPAEYRLVVTPVFETDSPKYKWLTEQQCVGFGRNSQIQGWFRRVSYDIYAMT
jgi:Protein of unknown function (DUF3237)